MKKLLTLWISLWVVLTCMVTIASAQMNVKDASVDKFNVQLVPYADVKLFSNEKSVDPLARYGVRVEANNIYGGAGMYLAVEGGEIDAEGVNYDANPNCTPEHPCTWPDSWVQDFEKSKSYISVFLGMQWKLKVFEK